MEVPLAGRDQHLLARWAVVPGSRAPKTRQDKSPMMWLWRCGKSSRKSGRPRMRLMRCFAAVLLKVTKDDEM